MQFFPALILRTTVLICLLAAMRIVSAPMIDLNHNGISDIWEQMYGASGLDPNGDADGDGVSNLREALAGTNPFDSNSYPHITAFGTSSTNFSVTVPVALGKVYQLLSVTNLGSTNWLVETTVVVRAGSAVPLLSTPGNTRKFFRIAISDTNTDGGGMSDWEKYHLGLDPLNPVSNGNLDGNGQLMRDYDYATNRLALQNVFTISATDSSTTQPDPGSSPTDLGVMTVTRGGFPLNTVTVNLGLGGPGPGFATEGLDHAALPRSVTLVAGVSSTNISVTPLANTNLHAPVIAQLKILPGTNYSIGNQSNAAVVIYPSPTPTGTGLLGQYYTNASSLAFSNTNNFNPTNLFLTRIDPVIDFNWTNGTSPNLSNGLYTVRWTGQVQPQYSETYVFDVKSDDSCRLWVNDQLLITNWQSQSLTDRTNSIALQAGVRYNIKLEYLQTNGAAQAHLYWYSPSQSSIIIPSNRLYPTNGASSGSNAPAVITSALSAVAFLNQPFSFQVTAANTPLNFTASGLPPGLNFTANSGLISGTPTLAGNFSVAVTASNAVGVGASVVNLQVIDTGTSVVREIWTNVPGTNVTDIPTSATASLTNTLSSLESTNFGSNYGERIRGYLTVPVTGNYYFWIAASDSAELWISNDGEPVNKLKRANVWPAGGGTAFHQWNTQTNQQSKWLSLIGGQKYYVEILHKVGTTPNDHCSVGWSQDAVGTNTAPGGVVPGYALSRYYPLPLVITPGTLYSANLLPEAGSPSSGSGSATMLVSADGSTATIKYAFNGLGNVTAVHLHADPYGSSVSKVLLFDIVPGQTPQQSDGSYVWPITASGALSAADVQELMREGKSFLDIHTAVDPNEPGEINGHYIPVNGSPTFTAPPDPPAWTDDHTDTNAAVRFLTQATFGASLSDITAVQTLGYTNWLNNQFSLPVSHHLPVVLANKSADPFDPFPSSLTFNTWWQQAVTAPDQLRQRVAFALSEILVVSENGTLSTFYAHGLSSYYDLLLDNAFGNYRTLLKAATLHPVMGVYLNMQGNDKGSLVTGLHANENYAREINQLFSIGLYRMWPDGTLVLNSQNSLVPTYVQNVISGFAAVFTGWNYYQTNQASGRLPTSWYPSSNYTNSMVLVPTHHDLGTKLLLDNVMLPAAQGNQTVSSTSTNDTYCSQDFEQAIDSIFNNPNVGPFVCRQLIQRLVTSNPSRDYLYRVVQKFNDDGTGVRGNLQAVISAILLDYQARSTAVSILNTYGKQREPLCRVTAVARAFPSPSGTGGTYSQSGTQTISINTTNAHRLNTGDTIALTFTDTSSQPSPPNGNYPVTVTATNALTITAPNLAIGTYGQSNTVITVTNSSHGLVVGNSIYLDFTSGGASNGVYQVVTVTSTSVFTVAASDSVTRAGNVLFPRVAAAGYKPSSGTNITVSCNGPHGLTNGQTIVININTVLIPPGQYLINTVPDATHFTFYITNSVTSTQSGFTLYPLVAPVLTRNGNVSAQISTWNMGYTDTGSTYNLSQTPLRSPTVFNFFYPSYQFPGTLASAGLTTPEFQLTSDTSVALQMNFLESGILTNSTSNANNVNTNGLSSYTTGSGAIMLDLNPWMGTNFTADANVLGLVNSLNTVLVAGQLSNAATTNIVNYVTNNFPTSLPTWRRDRVRAVVHQIINSPVFIIQR